MGRTRLSSRSRRSFVSTSTASISACTAPPATGRRSAHAASSALSSSRPVTRSFALLGPQASSTTRVDDQMSGGVVGPQSLQSNGRVTEVCLQQKSHETSLASTERGLSPDLRADDTTYHLPVSLYGPSPVLLADMATHYLAVSQLSADATPSGDTAVASSHTAATALLSPSSQDPTIIASLTSLNIDRAIVDSAEKRDLSTSNRSAVLPTSSSSAPDSPCHHLVSALQR